MRYICVVLTLLIVLNEHSTHASRSNKKSSKGSIEKTNKNTPNVVDICDSLKLKIKQRRISEEKCLEYICTKKKRDKQDKLEEDKRNAKGPLKITPCVLGGTDTVLGEFPHMGAVGWKAIQGAWIFKCGCSLISSKFTLTAAHCSRSSRDVRAEDSVPAIVRLGNRKIYGNIERGMYDSKILSIIRHPSYKAPKKYFDIALMEIEEIKIFTYNIQPACLWTHFDISPLGTSANLTGWGVVETATKTTSAKLQVASVDIIDSVQCDSLLSTTYNRNWWGIKGHQICAGKLAGGVDACQGDSGGPLQVKTSASDSTNLSMQYIIGVTSFGIGCGKPNLPGVYTRVSSFIDWIEQNVWAET